MNENLLAQLNFATAVKYGWIPLIQEARLRLELLEWAKIVCLELHQRSIGFHEFNGVDQLLNIASFTKIQKAESNEVLLERDQIKVGGVLYKATTDLEAQEWIKAI